MVVIFDIENWCFFVFFFYKEIFVNFLELLKGLVCFLVDVCLGFVVDYVIGIVRNFLEGYSLFVGLINF